MLQIFIYLYVIVGNGKKIVKDYKQSVAGCGTTGNCCILYKLEISSDVE